MRFVKVRPNYFRAFGSSDWISLDADLVVLYGPNGSGKTSLTEAIEWLLYGKTKRRERGEVLSQRDYFGSYRNAHAPATSGTSVEAVRARTRLQSDPPQTAVLARTQAERIVAAMRQSPRVSPIADRWASSVYDRKRDSGDLYSATLSFLGLANGDWSAITAALEQRREDAARRIFDDSPIRVPANLRIQRQELQTERQAVLSHVSALATAFDALVGATAAHFSQAKLQFWQTGLALVSVKRQDECPMCEARTLTTAKRSQLEQRIKQSATYTSALANLRRESERMSTFLRELARLGGLLFPKFLSAVQRSAMKGLFTDYQQSCDDFLSAHDATRTNSAQANQVLIDLASQIEAIPDLSTNPETVHIARDLISNLQSKLEAPVQCADQAATNFARAHVTFNHQLHQRIASTKTIQEIDGLLAPITGWQHIEVVAEYVQLLADSLEVVRQIEAHIQAKQAALFASRGREINNWYDLMNPGAAVRYKRMEAGTDNLSLWAESYGVEINAVACLSQCHPRGAFDHWH